MPHLVPRLLAVAAAAATFIAALVLLTGGINFTIGSLPVRARDPIVPSAIAAVLVGSALARPRAASDALAWWGHTLAAKARIAAALLAVAACAAGILWGARIAGGSDSYCYLNQAELIANGRLVEPVPLAAESPFAREMWPFVPAGHVPAPHAGAAIVPMCPAGYPLMMAAVRPWFGRPGMFMVVPLFGALAVWLTFLLGGRIAGRGAGLLSAALLAASPAFLYQIVQPMTDIPAAALWTLALVVATSPRPAPRLAWPLLPGLATGAALIVRPNLLPAGAIIGLWIMFRAWRASAADDGMRRALMAGAVFAAGVLPFALAVLAIQDAMYGSPLRSGYGDLGLLFQVAHIRPNLARYPVWLLETQTPFVLLAFAAPFVIRHGLARQAAWMLLAFAGAIAACYLPYSVFDAWWFIRFLLPAFPPLIALSAATAAALAGRLSLPSRTAAYVLVCLVLVAVQLGTAADREAFEIRDKEQRFRTAGEYVGARLPANAAVITLMQSGSVRFYSGRPTINWDAIEPGELDKAVAFLRTKGMQPFLLFESGEETRFRGKYAAQSRIGALEWPPVAEIDRDVRIFDPADYEPYMRGGEVQTDRIRTRRRP